MHDLVILAVDGVIAFDLATPIEVFGRARSLEGEPLYRVSLAGPHPVVSAGVTTITVDAGLDRLAGADTVIVPGRLDPDAPFDARACEAIREAALRGTRIASICVGALDLACTGLLDGLRATTHWRHTALLAERHPAVEVDPAALFVDNGRILTSAGAAAGLDLCLHMVAQDYGGAVGAEAARTAVMPLTRDGSQAQFIRSDELGALNLTAVLEWIDEHAAEPLTVDEIAAVATVSTRTLNRRFATELNTTPSAWLTRARVRRAQALLEGSDWPIERIAREAGLGTAANLRARFAAIVGTSPSRYRAALT